ncbi:MAG TPA: hypothetical protein VF665_23690 [Longimicrobium sp.]|jgi:hypothetical protein|uniref:hypothetical protein n=1 Tax=Longimicrobium sp. TaxID=2029185 RepID=UPI002EDAA5E8
MIPHSFMPRAAVLAALLAAGACESATTPAPRTTPRVENTPVAATPVAVGSGPNAFAGASVRFGGTAEAGGAPVTVAGSGAALSSVVQVAKSGGYTDASGRVITYQFRDSVRAVNLAVALSGAQSGAGVTLVVPGDVPAPGTYTVLGAMARPPFDLSRAAFASYGASSCAFTWVGESGTLTVTRSASGELEGTVDVRLRAVQRGVFVTPTAGPSGAGCQALTGVAGTPPETLRLSGAFSVR